MFHSLTRFEDLHHRNYQLLPQQEILGLKQGLPMTLTKGVQAAIGIIRAPLCPAEGCISG
jgi:hypothetical protein